MSVCRLSDWLVCCKTEKYFPVGHFQLLLFQQGYLVLLTLTVLSPTISLCLSSDVLALPIFKQEDSSLPSDCESSSLNPPFQYVLCAATSPAVKLHDETLTYLNQGDLVLSWRPVLTMRYIYIHTHTVMLSSVLSTAIRDVVCFQTAEILNH